MKYTKVIVDGEINKRGYQATYLATDLACTCTYIIFIIQFSLKT